MSRQNEIQESDAISTTAKVEDRQHLNLVDLAAHKTDKPMCQEDITTKQLSSVGHFLTTQVEKDEYCSGAAHPSLVHRFNTIDTETTEPIKLTDIFNSNDVYNALMNDKVVSKALSDANLHPQNFYQLDKLLSHEFIPVSSDIYGNEISSVLNDKILTDFAFHHLKGSGKQVAVRLLMDYNGEASHGSEDQLGILLPVPEELRGDLLDASNKEHGFLMKDSRTEGKESNFHRTYPF